jgi:Skp family chaperone for outer membrane proteins
MSQNPLWGRAIVLATIVLCIAFAVAASGRPEKTGTSFATVDINKISSDYKQKAVLEGELLAKKNKLERALARRQEMPLLTEEDQKILDTLMEKGEGTLADPEKKKIEEIKGRGNQMNSELIALRQKPEKDLNQADKDKIKGYEDVLNKTNTNGNALKESGLQEIDTFVKSKSEALLKDVREAIKKTAEQKGISIVFNSEVAPYAGQDVTSDVLKDLNKK